MNKDLKQKYYVKIFTKYTRKCNVLWCIAMMKMVSRINRINSNLV